MQPANFDDANVVLGPPPGVSEDKVQSLNVWRGRVRRDGTLEDAVVISCWKVTAEELGEIKRTGRVWLWLWGLTMPPASVMGTAPEFEAKP